MEETPWWAERYELLAEAAPGFCGSPDATAQAQVDFLCKLCNLGAGAKVLDLGCGVGRHTILLAERGHEVTGIDLSPRLIKRAREVWSERNPERAGPLFAPGDMRWPPVAGPFDAVIMLDVTLGVFEEDVDHVRTLAAARERLNSGGSLVLELFNPYFWAHHQVTRHHPAGSLVPDVDVVRTYRFNPVEGRLIDQVNFFDETGRHRVPDQRLRVWTPPELGALLSAAGFSGFQFFGSDGWQVPEIPLQLDAEKSAFLWVLATA